MKQRTPTIVMKPVESLKAAGFQPQSRTEKKAMQTLRELIVEAGEIIVPLTISTDGTVIDGHRRLAIARELGWPLVPCIVSTIGLQDGFRILGAGTRPLTGRDYLNAAVKGMDVHQVKESHRGDMKFILSLGGETLLQYVGDHNIGVNVAATTKAVGRYIGNESTEMLLKILYWLVGNKMQYMARKAMDAMIAPAVLEAAIDDNVALVLTQQWRTNS